MASHSSTPGKSHGRRSLVGCNPWGCKESDTTERLHFHFLLSCIAEGNGNPLQCSCLENPRDGRAWWVAVYGVTQKRLSINSSSSSNAKLGSQETPDITGKFGLGVQNEAGKTNRVLPREHIGHSKHPLPTTQEKTLHMDITR